MSNIIEYTMTIEGSKINVKEFIKMLNEKYNYYEDINIDDFEKATAKNDDDNCIAYKINSYFKNSFKNSFVYAYDDAYNLLSLTKVLNLKLAVIADNYNYAEHYIINNGSIMAENEYILLTENEENMDGIEDIRLNRIEALEKEVIDKCYTLSDLVENIKTYLFSYADRYHLLIEIINQISEKEDILQDYNYYTNNVHFFIDKFGSRYNVLSIIESLVKAWDYKYTTSDEYVKIDKWKSLCDRNLKGIESFNCYEVKAHLEENIYKILAKIVTRPYSIKVNDNKLAYMLTALKVMVITRKNK